MIYLYKLKFNGEIRYIFKNSRNLKLLSKLKFNNLMDQNSKLNKVMNKKRFFLYKIRLNLEIYLKLEYIFRKLRSATSIRYISKNYR